MKYNIIREKNGGDEFHHLKSPPGRDIVSRYGLVILDSLTFFASKGSYNRETIRRFDFYSISHLIDGAGRGWIGKKREFDIHSGDAVIVTPGVPHFYGGCPDAYYHEDSIIFTGPLADLFFEAGIIRCGIRHIGRIRRLLPIMDMLSNPSTISRLQACVALETLLLDISRAREKEETDTSFEELMTMLNNQPERWWTVDEMARLYGLSVEQFRRKFKKYTGRNPKAWLEELKLRRAAEYLIREKCTISEAAARLGYSDSLHFAKRFKHFHGTSPGEYRDSIQIQKL